MENKMRKLKYSVGDIVTSITFNEQSGKIVKVTGRFLEDGDPFYKVKTEDGKIHYIVESMLDLKQKNNENEYEEESKEFEYNVGDIVTSFALDNQSGKIIKITDEIANSGAPIYVVQTTDGKIHHIVEDLLESYNKDAKDEKENEEEISNIYGINEKTSKEEILKLLSEDEFVTDISGYISDELCKDRDVVMALVKNDDRYILDFTSDDLRDDKEIAMELLTHWGDGLRKLSERLRNDKEVVLKALPDCYDDTMNYISEELKNDKEFILEAMKYNSHIFKYANRNLMSDREFVMQLAKMNSYALNYATDEIKNDRDFVSEVMKNDAHALAYASEELKNDRELVLTALKNGGRIFYGISDELKGDKEIVLEAIKKCTNIYYDVLQYMSEELKDDRDVMLEAIKNNGFALKYASEELKNDKELIKIANNDIIKYIMKEEQIEIQDVIDKYSDKLYKSDESIEYSEEEIMLQIDEEKKHSMKEVEDVAFMRTMSDINKCIAETRNKFNEHLKKYGLDDIELEK